MAIDWFIQALSKPRWSDGSIVSYRIDTLAAVLWLVGWPLWVVATYSAFFGSFSVLGIAFAGFAASRVAANQRLRRVVRQLEAADAGEELIMARGASARVRGFWRRRLDSAAMRSERKAREREVRASVAEGHGKRRAASGHRSRANRDRRRAKDARKMARQFEFGADDREVGR